MMATDKPGFAESIRDLMIAPPEYTEPEHGTLPGDGSKKRQLPLLLIAAWTVIGLAITAIVW